MIYYNSPVDMSCSIITMEKKITSISKYDTVQSNHVILYFSVSNLTKEMTTEELRMFNIFTVSAVYTHQKTRAILL